MVNEEKRRIQLEAFEALKKNGFNGTVILPTGVGKTWILIECLKHLEDKTNSILYTCDNRKLRDVDFPEQLLEWDGEHFLDKMQRLCYQSAYKLRKQKFDVGLFDEGDYSLTKKYAELYKYNKFKHKILVSATLDEDKRAMVEEIAPIVYEKKMDEIEGQGIVNPAKLYFVNYMLRPEENAKYLSYNDVFKRELNKDKPNRFTLKMIQQGRKRFLGGLLSSQKVCHRLMKKLYLEKEENKILIFCLLSKQADDICRYSYHSKNEKANEFLEMFDRGDIRIIAVCGKVDRGQNLNGVNHIIFEAPAESETKFIQKSGRGRRLAVDDFLSMYFLVPFYKDRRGEIKPTVVQKWVFNSTKQLGQPIETITL